MVGKWQDIGKVTILGRLDAHFSQNHEDDCGRKRWKFFLRIWQSLCRNFKLVNLRTSPAFGGPTSNQPTTTGQPEPTCEGSRPTSALVAFKKKCVPMVFLFFRIQIVKTHLFASYRLVLPWLFNLDRSFIRNVSVFIVSSMYPRLARDDTIKAQLLSKQPDQISARLHGNVALISMKDGWKSSTFCSKTTEVCKQKFDVNFLHWNKSENDTIKLPQWQANSNHWHCSWKALHRAQIWLELQSTSTDVRKKTTKIVWEMAENHLQETIRNHCRRLFVAWLCSLFFASQQLTVLWPSATFVSIMALCGRICKGNWKRCFWSSEATNESRTSGTNPTEPASYGHLWGT